MGMEKGAAVGKWSGDASEGRKQRDPRTCAGLVAVQGGSGRSPSCLLAY